MKRWYFAAGMAALGLYGTACKDTPTSPLSTKGPTPNVRASGGVTGAAFTTTNPFDADGTTVIDGTGHCKNGNEAVNCNIYDGKTYVWLTGGPLSAAVGDGTYMFAVLAPGGQHDPNDGTAKNLSDLAPTTSTGAGDVWTNRVFSVASGVISYSGTHDFKNNKIRLFPYDDTPNPGGVYILAICRLDNPNPSATNPPGVDPSICKYDAFKVVTAGSTPGAEDLTVSKDANGAYTKSFAWKIAKNASPVLVQQATGSANITYTVTVSRDQANDAIATVGVSGTITVTNPNPADVSVTITDHLTDASSTACTVKNGDGSALSGNPSVGFGDTGFQYTCSLSALPDPSSPIANYVRVDWAQQTLGVGTLAAGYAQFQTDPITFTENTSGDLHTTVSVTDAFNGGSAIPIGTLLSPTGTSTVDLTTAPRTFTYVRSIPVTANQCLVYPNTATITETGQTANASVTICGPVSGGLTIGFWSNKNGKTVLCNNDPGWRNLLDGLSSPPGGGSYLRNASGSSFFTVSLSASCANADASFSTWLLNATATNMSYMLSAQLSATELNIAYNGMNGTLLVTDPQTGNPATINSIIANAITFLRANGNTTASGAARNLATGYKTLFDGLNNGIVTVVPGP